MLSALAQSFGPAPYSALGTQPFYQYLSGPSISMIPAHGAEVAGVESEDVKHRSHLWGQLPRSIVVVATSSAPCGHARRVLDANKDRWPCCLRGEDDHLTLRPDIRDLQLRAGVAAALLEALVPRRSFVVDE